MEIKAEEMSSSNPRDTESSRNHSDKACELQGTQAILNNAASEQTAAAPGHNLRVCLPVCTTAQEASEVL